jgi:hypothetical protein
MRNKDFRSEFEYFWKRVFFDKKPTYFVRYADGEAGLLQGKSFDATNQIDGWVSKGFNQFNLDLANALRHKEDDYFYGISCQCCDPSTKDYLLKLLLCPEDQITYSNLWINGNYNEFKSRLSSIIEPVIIVGNEQGQNKTFPFPVFDYFPISNQVVEDWKIQRDSFISAYFKILDQQNLLNQLVLFAAGPLSEILIDFSKGSGTGIHGRFIDVGSSLDEYIFGHPTREYMIPGSYLNTKMCTL